MIATSALSGRSGMGNYSGCSSPKGSIDGAMEPAHTIDADERLSHLQALMEEHNISRFVVTEGEKISGIVTETDLAVSLRKFREKIEDRHQDFRFHNIIVRTIMTYPDSHDRPEYKDGRYCQHDAEKKYQFNPGRRQRQTGWHDHATLAC